MNAKTVALDTAALKRNVNSDVRKLVTHAFDFALRRNDLDICEIHIKASNVFVNSLNFIFIDHDLFGSFSTLNLERNMVQWQTNKLFTIYSDDLKIKVIHLYICIFL